MKTKRTSSLKVYSEAKILKDIVQIYNIRIFQTVPQIYNVRTKFLTCPECHQDLLKIIIVTASCIYFVKFTSVLIAVVKEVGMEESIFITLSQCVVIAVVTV
jgi:hypothetical protein